MIAFLSLFVHVVVSPLKTRARLEAEIVLLRNQLKLLRGRVPSRPKLTVVPTGNIVRSRLSSRIS